MCEHVHMRAGAHWGQKMVSESLVHKFLGGGDMDA